MNTIRFQLFGIDTEIPLSAKEVAIKFRDRIFHYLPETDSVSRMIRVETGRS